MNRLIKSFIFVSYVVIHAHCSFVRGQSAPDVIDFEPAINNYVLVAGGTEMFYTTTLEHPGKRALCHSKEIVTGDNVTYLKGQLLTPEDVRLNYVDSKNPLYDATIDHISTNITGKLPIVVLANEPSGIYSFDPVLTTSHQVVVSANQLPDVNGNVTAGIINLCCIVTPTTNTSGCEYIVAAVKQAEGPLNTNAYGLALVKKNLSSVKIGTRIEPEDKKEIDIMEQRYQFQVLDAVGSDTSHPKAYPLHCDAFSLNGGLEMLKPDSFCFHFEPTLFRFFVGVCAKSKDNAGLDQGVCSIAVGRVEQDRLYLEPLADSAIFTTDEQIVGIKEANQWSCVHTIKTMRTSTGLMYLLVVGGIGNPEDTKNQLYALPLCVNNYQEKQTVAALMTDKNRGTLASCDEATPYYTNNYFSHRQFKNKIQKHELSSPKCIVGNQQLPGVIKQIVVQTDAVYVLVALNEQQTIIMHSQAILDYNGAIASWTPWQVLAGWHPDVVDFRVYNGTSFLFMYVKNKDYGITYDKTSWITDIKQATEKPQTLTALCNTFFTKENGGVKQVSVLSPRINGIAAEGTLCGLLLVGNKSIMLAQTGFESIDNDLKNYNETLAEVHCTNGCLENINSLENPTVIGISGGHLETIAPLTCAMLAKNEHQTWLFVGGLKGLVVLTDDNGFGFDNNLGLGMNFRHFRPSMSFKKIKGIDCVKKLMNDAQNLYISTGKELIRTSLSNFSVDNPESSILACIERGIYDAGVSDNVALLATSQGLLRNGNGTNIATISPNDISWVPVTACNKRIRSLHFITAKGNEADFAHKGQVYVVSNNYERKSTIIERLFVDNQNGVHDKTVSKVPDLFCNNQEIPFVELPGFHNNFFTDGSFYLSAQTRSAQTSPTMFKINPLIGKKNKLRTEIIPLELDDSQSVNCVVRDYITGNVYIFADDGVRIHG